MPPKKSATTESHPAGAIDPGADSEPPKQEAEAKAEASETMGASGDKNATKQENTEVKEPPTKVPSKRKAKATDEPSKAPRRSARGVQQAPSDPIQVVKFLLSPASLDLCRPKDEIEDLKARGPDTRTYSSSDFSPFEELVCAVILSRPISHALGLRSIRTIFNGPYEFTTPKKIREAGTEGCRKALDEARTQHRQKTAEELVILADAVVESLGDGEEDVSLERVRKESDHDVDKEREMLKKNVKGLGKTGLDIFFRRIQGVWPVSYPFADQRTLLALGKLGLPDDAGELKELLDENWEGLNAKNIEAKDKDEKKRKAFVRILERAVGADLEGNVDSVKTEAGNAS